MDLNFMPFRDGWDLKEGFLELVEIKIPITPLWTDADLIKEIIADDRFDDLRPVNVIQALCLINSRGVWCNIIFQEKKKEENTFNLPDLKFLKLKFPTRVP